MQKIAWEIAALSRLPPKSGTIFLKAFGFWTHFQSSEVSLKHTCLDWPILFTRLLWWTLFLMPALLFSWTIPSWFSALESLQLILCYMSYLLSLLLASKRLIKCVFDGKRMLTQSYLQQASPSVRGKRLVNAFLWVVWQQLFNALRKVTFMKASPSARGKGLVSSHSAKNRLGNRSSVSATPREWHSLPQRIWVLDSLP